MSDERNHYGGAILGRLERRSRPGQLQRLFVRTAGSDGPPFVLLHGLASSSRYWLGNAGELSADHRLLMPDLLGFGRSPKPFESAYTPAEHVEWLHRTLSLFSGGPFAIGGHSLGALLALRYAVEHPCDVRALALISLPVIGCVPWGHREDGGMQLLHRFVAHTGLGTRAMGGIIRVAAPIGRHVAPLLQHDVPREAAMDALQVTSASYWRTLETVIYGVDVGALLDAVRVPVLMVHGADDRTAPLEPVRTLLQTRPALRLHVIPGAGHNPWYTHPHETAAVLRRFLDERATMAPGTAAAGAHAGA